MILRFIHVPKTAGVSILESLNKSISYLGKEKSKEWEIRGVNGSYHSRSSEPSIRVSEPKDMNNGDVIQESPVDFSFSFIRNPWDRFVSAYAYLNEKKNEEYEKYIKPFKTFKDFAIEGSTESLHFLPQTYWIDSQINFVGRFERISSHLEGLCKSIGLPIRPIKKLNKTEHKPYWDYYDPESRNAIAQKYSQDIKLLGYSFTDYSHPKKASV